jgi:hypothetical protein
VSEANATYALNLSRAEIGALVDAELSGAASVFAKTRGMDRFTPAFREAIVAAKRQLDDALEWIDRVNPQLKAGDSHAIPV